MSDLNKIRKRVEGYDLWFDRQRAALKAAFGGEDFTKLRARFESANRSCAIIEGATAYCRERGIWFPELPNNSARYGLSLAKCEVINSKMDIPLPPGDPVSAAFSLVPKYPEFFQNSSSSIQQIERHIVKEEAKKLVHMLDFIDASVSHIAIDSLVNPNTELFILDSSLAKRIISSNNSAITAEDLVNIPFNSLMLEFSSPVEVVKLRDKVLKVLAVGFYKNHEAGCYVATYYSEVNALKGEVGKNLLFNMPAQLSVVQSPLGFSRIVNDDGIRKALNMEFSSYNIRAEGAVIYPFEGDYSRYFSDHNSVVNQIGIVTRNIWDFITSRNIDYIPCSRSTFDFSKIKKYKHLQGKMHLGPRMYKVLELSKRIEEYSPTNSGRTFELGYREHVPGTFHKWIYCKSCGRTHRHDLIGQSCRKCNLTVGPLNNILVKKYWHTDYYRGSGELKEVIREVRE